MQTQIIWGKWLRVFLYLSHIMVFTDILFVGFVFLKKGPFVGLSVEVVKALIPHAEKLCQELIL